ncbi:MAG: hypothetical protein A3G33_04060 [Omnitrophica bacterium RIFCSPLOWO2_12_FULL_44_17]|uniref:Thioredoxin-like fold domain-containing protein n=1 Tax=Candidatus Danuiimicrobium aquiferis TaxID=1801832 RepID=A0A1G1KZG0_9BACT|nr:MAG: hypothetical protein A3B72_10265 [Omnitrophica bacterium RIFCSPHIGHO2_02_FULL_45_28]OGW91898.1 MAG: hypothetical protein A3E74_00815 [Omnitrophica bacterium RIFCSPHIGHO2_12_FULL_44_12]OGW98271.1 MAG: hypothetical protein A3G33_04060 [Omnitrophica bacterium RIFCSPLOWO2_12_FULL_44_17]OGX01833.1 MAG: hypothetical protein A3J12_06990 [Omnitrophica bacterium RIFCSPLOWO2_02_FULL_44_11]
MNTAKHYILTGGIIVFILIVSVAASKFTQGKILKSVEQGTKFKGNKKASIRLVVYSDFQCPACSYGSTVVDDIAKDLKDKVSVEYKYFPLAMHKWALEAALFAECAADQGKFWEYHDLLFKKQKEWSKEGRPTAYFWNFMKELKLDTGKIEKCVTDEKVLQRIQKDSDSGKQLQVSSTPTIFVNDKRFVGGKQLDAEGKKYIAEELKKIGMDWKYTSTPLPPPPVAAQPALNPLIANQHPPHNIPIPTAQPVKNTVPTAAIENKKITPIPGAPSKNSDAGEPVGRSDGNSSFFR